MPMAVELKVESTILSDADQSRQQPLSEMRLILSVRYADAKQEASGTNVARCTYTIELHETYGLDVLLLWIVVGI